MNTGKKWDREDWLAVAVIYVFGVFVGLVIGRALWVGI